MHFSREQMAGAIFFVAVTQFILGLIISEALYPGYSVHDNYISDLGVGPSSLVFNASVVLLGVLSLVAVYFLRQNISLKMVNRFLFLMGLGAIGVGVFTKDFTLVHGAVSSMAFFFGGLSALVSFKVLKQPLSLVSIALGAITLGALALFSLGMWASGSMTSTEALDSGYYLGLGPGGIERMIVYPLLIWLAGFAGYLVTAQEL